MTYPKLLAAKLARAAASRRGALVFVLIAGIWAACAEAPHGFLSHAAAPPPPEIEQACQLATTKCARCHPIERVTVARGVGPARWSMYVDEMRLKPSSGISPSDAQIILSCLRFFDESCADCKRGHS